MLTTIISQYLTLHKRLVIPQLGAFIVKQPDGEVLFSELLRRDDGVLRGLLRERGMGELEAAGEIDRFVFELRHAVEHGEEFPLAGFGVMRPGQNGTIAFEWTPSVAAPDAVPAVEEHATPVAAEPATERADEPAGQSEPEEESAPKSDIGPAQPSQADRVAEAVKTAFAEPHLSSTMNPDPSVKGLRYGKPPKNTNAYSFVDRPPRRRTLDRLLIWLGIVVAAFVLAIIAYVFYKNNQEQEAMAATTTQVKIPVADNRPAAQTTESL